MEFANNNRFQPVNLAEVQSAIEADNFIHKQNCGCGHPVLTFRIPGQSIEGRLRTCDKHDRKDRARCAHIHYLTDTGEESVAAIRLSRFLWLAITKNKEHGQLWGRIVRITYKGEEKTGYGHARKIYLVEVDKGSITENFQESEVKNAKYRKPKPHRPIRRPKNG